MKKVRPQKYDRSIYGTFGQFFTHNNSPVFYLNTALPIDNINWIKPVRDILNISEVDFDELVQRNLDDSRIKNDISQYLITDKGYKFFPPIVSAFVAPTEKKDSIKNRYPKLKVRFEETVEGKVVKIEFEDSFILILFVDEDNNILNTPVELRWKSSGISLMAVDGQHRLVTLKAIRGLLDSDDEKAYYKSLEEHKSILNDIDIPTTILFFPNSYQDLSEGSEEILDEVFPNSGWLENEQKDIKEIIRNVFVDVNKNAKTPSESRNILLNEKDICAIFARHIFSTIKEIDKNTYSYLLDFDSPRNKEFQIDQNRPIITTIGIVYRICENLFKDTKGDRRKSEDGNALRARLNLYDLEFDSESVKLEDLTPFDFSYSQRRVLLEQFKKSWTQTFVYFYTHLLPFKKLYISMNKSFEDWLEKTRKDSLTDDETKIYSVLFGGSEKRFFLQQNAKNRGVEYNDYRFLFKKLQNKEKEIKESIGNHRFFFSQMFQSAFFEFLDFILSSPTIDYKNSWLEQEYLDSIINILNKYIEDKHNDSLFNFENSINDLLFNGRSNPSQKKQELVATIIKLIAFNYKREISENPFINKFNVISDFIDELNIECLDIIDKNMTDSLEKEFKQNIDIRQLVLDIQKAKNDKLVNEIKKLESDYKKN
ncbi:DNA sulfur modification protein DndB [Flavobacterium sp. CS20]|uniref:DNA sulfur modification protein DndB n=1 Tax=Flavobacterium sp. CS20 TaxID=2775246 RepID=UPI001B3A1DBC|nr:DNA sulfur modification protein DndB [Flavobacterium sp. CS20]QTY26354.1 hypothetical protein IGB25_10425 [Flavobacterium sp. CS20]